jgi:hypothetical protein
LKLDGTPAVEGVDYALWEGEYHKNGKWSYTEGGVALKNGIVIYNSCSTHYRFDEQRWVKYIIDNEVKGENFVMGRFRETSERPTPPNEFPFEEGGLG